MLPHDHTPSCADPKRRCEVRIRAVAHQIKYDSRLDGLTDSGQFGYLHSAQPSERDHADADCTHSNAFLHAPVTCTWYVFELAAIDECPNAMSLYSGEEA